MATANTAPPGARQPSRWLRNLLLLALVVAGTAAAFFWSRMREASTARAASAAQVGCLCRYVSGRSMSACAGDPAVMQEWVSLNEDAAARAIVATVPTLARQTARWSRDSGCVLEPWKD